MGGINANEMAGKGDTGFVANMQVNEQACRGQYVLSETLIGFLQTSCEAKSPSSRVRAALYIKSSASRATWPPLTLQVHACLPLTLC